MEAREGCSSWGRGDMGGVFCVSRGGVKGGSQASDVGREHPPSSSHGGGGTDRVGGVVVWDPPLSLRRAPRSQLRGCQRGGVGVSGDDIDGGPGGDIGIVVAVGDRCTSGGGETPCSNAELGRGEARPQTRKRPSRAPGPTDTSGPGWPGAGPRNCSSEQGEDTSQGGGEVGSGGGKRGGSGACDGGPSVG